MRGMSDKLQLDEEINVNTIQPTMLLQNDKANTVLNLVYCVLLALFLVSLNGLQKFPVLFFVNKASAGLLIIISFIATGKFYVGRLLQVFAMFVAFSFFTGVFVAVDQTLLWDTTMKLVQLILLLVCVSQFYIFKGNVKWLMIALLLNGLVMAFAGNFLSPDLMFSGKIERYSSISNNSNGLAFQLLLGLFGALYFYKDKGWLIKCLVIVAAGVFMYYIAISGSRKSSAAFVLIILAWVFFSFKMKKMLQISMGLFVIFLIGGSYMYTMLADTAVVQRFSYLEDDQSAADIRTILYREAFDLFMANPFFGVGLANFQQHSVTGLYAHSNYVELLADTGIIGFAIYYSIYLMVWINSNKLVNAFDGEETIVYLSGISKCIIILFLVIGAGAVQYDNIQHWILLLFPIILYERATLLEAEHNKIEAPEEPLLEEHENIPA